MGLFTQLGQMKDLITAAPALIESANQLAASTQTQVAMSGAVIGGTTVMTGVPAGVPGTIGSQAAVDHANLALYGEPTAAMLEPIAGVDLAAYAKVSKGIAAYGYDTTKLVDVARSLGIAAADWETAAAGWGARIQADRAVGSRFNQLYTAL